MTGAGVDEFFEAVAEKAEEFEREYRPELERRRKQREDQIEEHRQKELGKLMKDMAVSAEGSQNVPKPPSREEDMDTLSDLENEDEDEEIEDGNGESENGLQQRYKQALETSGSGAPDPDDYSFARYIRASQLGM
jgi:hypothetical protein